MMIEITIWYLLFVSIVLIWTSILSVRLHFVARHAEKEMQSWKAWGQRCTDYAEASLRRANDFYIEKLKALKENRVIKADAEEKYDEIMGKCRRVHDSIHAMCNGNISAGVMMEVGGRVTEYLRHLEREVLIPWEEANNVVNKTQAQDETHNQEDPALPGVTMTKSHTGRILVVKNDPT